MNRALKEIAKAVLPASMVAAWQVRRALRGSPEPELRLLPALARGGLFLDVGANMGGWCGPASRVFAEVHAFEPIPPLAAALRGAVPANVTVHELALSDHEGSGRFAVPIYDGRAVTTRASLERDANTGFDDEAVHEVRLARLDTLTLVDVDAMKIDVEGHEAAVLAGAHETIERERPTLIVEIEERHHPGQSEAIIQSVVSRGYLCCYLHHERVERFVPGCLGELQPPDAWPVAGRRSADYVNNFIFVPNERGHEIEAMARFIAHQRE